MKKRRFLTVERAREIVRQEYGENISRTIFEKWIRSGLCPFGVYVKGKGNRGTYLIFRGRMDAFYKAQDGMCLYEHSGALSDIGGFEIEPPNPSGGFYAGE